MTIRNYSQRLGCAVTAALLAICATQADAGPLALSDTPLFLSTGVNPNLIMAIDDSGSMDFEVLLKGNDGAAWWRTNAADSGTCVTSNGANSFAGCLANAAGTADEPGTGLNFNNAGISNDTWKKYAYLFPNGGGDDSSNRRRLTDARNDHFAIPPLAVYAWSRSPDYNSAYFNPQVVYTPWVSGGGFTFGNASLTATRFDPVFDGAATINLKQDFAGISSVDPTAACSDAALSKPDDNYYFRVYQGMTIPSGTCVYVSSYWDPGRRDRDNPVAFPDAVRHWGTANGSCVVGTNSGCTIRIGGTDQKFTLTTAANVAIRYFPATFYLTTQTPPAKLVGYTATPPLAATAPDGKKLYRYELKLANFGNNTTNYNAALQNFVNWFSYYRKRHQALRAGLGLAFNTLSAMNVGGFTINQSGKPTEPDVSMGTIDDANARNTLYQNFYKNWVHSGGTPNRAAVANLIRNYKRTDGGAPVQYSCQRNFGMLFTDGFSNPPDDNDGGDVANVDGNQGAPYADDQEDTLADRVMSAYLNPLRTGQGFEPGRVKVPAACDAGSPAANVDCNKNLHMNFYAITLGTRGLQFNPDITQDPYQTPTPKWPTAFPARHPSAVDDLWHATINGRGQLLNAKTSNELADKLSAVLQSIADTNGSASSAAVNSGSISANSRVYQARFDSGDWSGILTAAKINTDGTLDPLPVTATLPAFGSREILTMNSDGSLVPFKWSSLDATRKTQLDATAADVTAGDKLINFLRGDHSNEAPQAGDPTGTKYRRRSTSLGDIVNSAPTFVGAPNFHYSDALESAKYSEYRAANLNRDHMIYVGANDGMLHAFKSDDSAANGRGGVSESWAYVPGVVLKNMKSLTDQRYVHKYFVDGTPTTGDAFVGGQWRTMLVAGLNKGGQGIYALDVTNPAGISESNRSVLHWEFTDANDADLGFTFARPQIVRMQTGKWAAVFGNGYNNTIPDETTSGSGDAVLYVVDLETGALIKKIDTKQGTAQDPKGAGRPNGLSTPVVVDVNNDSIADFAYAGDLFGNLWKFDLNSSDTDDWKVAYGDDATPAPLFVAENADGVRQAITSRPNVSRGPNGRGLIIVFGTGKYIETGDGVLANIPTQSFYGLIDPNSGASTDVIASRDNLTQQSITNEVMGVVFFYIDDEGNRHEFPNDVRVTSANLQDADSRGWYIDLVSPSGFQGEMQVTDSIIRNGHVLFTTLVPNSDPCGDGGSSWLMELSLFNGARLENTPFELSGNGKFDDMVQINGTATEISGVRSQVGIEPKGGLISGDKCDFIIFPGSSGNTETRCRDPGARGFGRQSWRQAR